MAQASVLVSWLSGDTRRHFPIRASWTLDLLIAMEYSGTNWHPLMPCKGRILTLGPKPAQRFLLRWGSVRHLSAKEANRYPMLGPILPEFKAYPNHVALSPASCSIPVLYAGVTHLLPEAPSPPVLSCINHHTSCWNAFQWPHPLQTVCFLENRNTKATSKMLWI